MQTKSILTVTQFFYELSDSKYLDARECHDMLKNGKTASPWLHAIAPCIYPFLKDLGKSNCQSVEIKCLTKTGVKFQRSIHTGANRECTLEDLAAAVSEKDYYIVFDITNSPYFKSVVIPCYYIDNLIQNGDITTNGLNHEKFWDFLDRDFLLTTHTIFT